MALLKQLKRMGYNGLTMYVFPLKFGLGGRTNELSQPGTLRRWRWCVGSKSEAAYWRGDMFEKRRRSMDAWAEY